MLLKDDGSLIRAQLNIIKLTFQYTMKLFMNALREKYNTAKEDVSMNPPETPQSSYEYALLTLLLLKIMRQVRLKRGLNRLTSSSLQARVPQPKALLRKSLKGFYKRTWITDGAAFIWDNPFCDIYLCKALLPLFYPPFKLFIFFGTWSISERKNRH